MGVIKNTQKYELNLTEKPAGSLKSDRIDPKILLIIILFSILFIGIFSAIGVKSMKPSETESTFVYETYGTEETINVLSETTSETSAEVFVLN